MASTRHQKISKSVEKFDVIDVRLYLDRIWLVFRQYLILGIKCDMGKLNFELVVIYRTCV